MKQQWTARSMLILLPDLEIYTAEDRELWGRGCPWGKPGFHQGHRKSKFREEVEGHSGSTVYKGRVQKSRRVNGALAESRGVQSSVVRDASMNLNFEQ